MSSGEFASLGSYDFVGTFGLGHKEDISRNHLSGQNAGGDAMTSY